VGRIRLGDSITRIKSAAPRLNSLIHWLIMARFDSIFLYAIENAALGKIEGMFDTAQTFIAAEPYCRA
jgi:hypothetical protein